MVVGLTRPPAAGLVLVVLFLVERLVELAVSRARLRGRLGRRAGGDWEWSAMVAVHVALLVLPPVEAAVLGARAPRWLLVAAILAALAAQGLRAWCIVSLGAAWNARAQVDPSLPVVDRGPYRRIRHPNYLAVLIEFLALPLAFGAWRSGLILNLLHSPLIARRIRAEERLLREVPGYTQRMGAKGRFWPRRGVRPSVRKVSQRDPVEGPPVRSHLDALRKPADNLDQPQIFP